MRRQKDKTRKKGKMTFAHNVEMAWAKKKQTENQSCDGSGNPANPTIWTGICIVFVAAGHKIEYERWCGVKTIAFDVIPIGG